ncbi:MAG: serine/threonine protein kinase [Myxococcota bacterium]|jgi:serine/threonine-protein kinase|nr:serine/threonine protein kinase [Myxococcota bacterium]
MTSAARSLTHSVEWPDEVEPIVELGRGGMATVTLALRRGAFGFAAPIAVKRLLPQFVSESCFVDMFLDECALLSRIEHPNVVAVRGLLQFRQEPLLLLEYLEGLTASQLVKGFLVRDELIPVEIATQIAVDGLRGLEHAHSLRADDGSFEHVIHRDVSPQNLFVCVDGRTKLIDFGVSRADHRLAHTRTGILKGKLAYMAPEQLGTDYDHRVDVFAMGVVLYELLTSTRLFRGRDEREILGALMTAELPLVTTLRPDCPPQLAEIVRVALERDPERRFASAGVMADALAEAVERGGRLESGLGAVVLEHCREQVRTHRERIAAFRGRSREAGGASAVDPRAATEVWEPEAASQPSSSSSASRSLVRAVPTRPRWRSLLVAAGVMTAGAIASVTALDVALPAENVDTSTATSNRDATSRAATSPVHQSATSRAATTFEATARTERDSASSTRGLDTGAMETRGASTGDAPERSDSASERTIAATFRTTREGVTVRLRGASCAAPCVLQLDATTNVEVVEVEDTRGLARRIEVSLRDDLLVDLDLVLSHEVLPRDASRRLRSRSRAKSSVTSAVERFPTFD